MLQLRVGLLEVLDQVVQRLQHLFHVAGHRGLTLALGGGVQSPAGRRGGDGGEELVTQSRHITTHPREVTGENVWE